MNFKQTIIKLTLACVLLFSSTSEAATLHAILIGDTIGENIEKSVLKDLQYVQKELDLIEKYTRLTIKKNCHYGRSDISRYYQ